MQGRGSSEVRLHPSRWRCDDPNRNGRIVRCDRAWKGVWRIDVPKQAVSVHSSRERERVFATCPRCRPVGYARPSPARHPQDVSEHRSEVSLVATAAARVLVQCAARSHLWILRAASFCMRAAILHSRARRGDMLEARTLFSPVDFPPRAGLAYSLTMVRKTPRRYVVLCGINLQHEVIFRLARPF